MPTLVLQTSRLPLILIWTMYFNGQMIALGVSLTCKEGQRVVMRQSSNTRSCEQCLEGYYQPEASDSMQCEVCTKCGKGSEVQSPCTVTANTVCRCLKGFRHRVPDFSICKCEKGSGKNNDGSECRKCEAGYFSSEMNSHCKPWTKCKENKHNGTDISDAVCQPHNHLPPSTMTPGLKTETISLRTLHTSPPPEISTTTGLPHQKTTANLTPAAFRHRRNHVIVQVNVGLLILLILTAVVITCKDKDPACKSPIKETQQEKFHVIDTV